MSTDTIEIIIFLVANVGFYWYGYFHGRKHERIGDTFTWNEAERNTINEIICRVYTGDGESIQEFWTWWAEQPVGAWFGPHRAAGAWLSQKLAEEQGL